MFKKSNKFFIVVVIVLVLMLNFQGGFAENIDLEEIGYKLKALGLFIGDDKGNMNFDKNISRAEFAVVAARLIGKEEEAITKIGPTIFKDVPEGHWASGHINITTDAELIVGYEDGTFKLNNNITHGEVLTIMVNALGYGSDVPPENWPENFVSKASELGLTKDVSFDSKAPATRADIALMLNNSLTIPIKNR
jgi:hypothetical protein